MITVEDRNLVIAKNEYLEYLDEISAYETLVDKILDGTIEPSVNVVIDLPFELMDLLDRLGDQDKAYDLIEYTLRHCIPVLENKALMEKDGLWMELENKLKFFMTYKNMNGVFEPYMSILIHTVGYFANKIKNIFYKYNIDKNYVMLLINRERSISKNIEVYMYSNVYDPETGEWYNGEQ